ncbi:hypothetical protein BD410DRAFT_784609 [Rickenella mellea]|uniref:Uncharacterized protein n=1 Tax=Rickenella mellea TaxID=50990 RepID=A0A4Y7QDV7_9AGAM|nr:hypothetical protein BD410DRAFT_784609 [Rickenella mellea]
MILHGIIAIEGNPEIILRGDNLYDWASNIDRLAVCPTSHQTPLLHPRPHIYMWHLSGANTVVIAMLA